MPNSSPPRDMLVLLCAAAAAALAIFPLLVPAHDFDRGIFVSVAERLLAGDTLYAGVWDNKGPLFYYLVAGERLAGSSGEILAEIFLVALSSYSVFKLVAVFSFRMETILVTPSFAPEQGQPDWNRFVAAGEKLRSSGFHCQHRDIFRVCRRISPAA